MKEKAFLVVIAAACIGGFGGIFINNISMSSTSIAWMRTTVPTLILGIIMLAQGKKLFRGNFWGLFNISLFNSVRIYFFVLAYSLTAIGNAVVVFYTYPIFTLLIANRMLGESVSKRQMFLIFLSFAGLIVIYSNKTFSFADNDFVGMLSALTASILFAFVVIFMKKMSDNYNQVEILFYQNFIGVLVFLPFFILALPDVTLPNLGFGAAYGIVIGMVVYYLFLYGLKRMKASIATSLMYMEIPSTILLGYFFLEETISLNFVVGALMIIISSILIKNR